MAGMFWMMCLSLLTQGFWCILGDIEVGCKKWSPIGDTFVCNECHPGNYLVKKHGRTPTELCTPCENGTFTEKTDDKECYICRQCVGALVHLKDCTPKSDTQCACKKGLVCGNEKCTYCVDECGKGYEPDSNNRSCRPCPEGTFNDKIHQKCKPFSTRTPTDDPRTLIAIECSFHEAQQEQGNSTESLISKDSSEQETV
ncbi:hypothetical protein ILYODFUR_027828 [Ilyodon furcidens]|uniref:TNFR-Cys domain-containing protein n=1 Tax=Ilyodon furcidens TaxID=33524 RepID=A0ABV0VHS3_9TELE